MLDSHETVLQVTEPVTETSQAEKSPGFDFVVTLGIFLSLSIFPRRKR